MAKPPGPARPFGQIAQGQKAGLFDPAGLIQAAEAECTNLPPLDRLAHDGLLHLSADLTALGPGLSFLGKKLLQRALIDTLLKRAYTPPLPQTAPPAVFITSPFRSGSTFLHRLLACDPQFRWTPTWQVSQPNVPGMAQAETIAKVGSYLERTEALSPDLQRLHPTQATAPEECFGLLEPSFLSPSFLFWGHLPGYQTWLNGRSNSDWMAAYQWYAAGLRGLGPADDMRPWLLKSPFHQWGQGALMAVFANAPLIQITRHSGDPLASTTALLAANRSVFARRGADTHSTTDAAEMVQTAKARAQAARETAPHRFLDIDFEDLIAHPIQTVEKIYDWHGLELTTDARTLMLGYLAAYSPKPLA